MTTNFLANINGSQTDLSNIFESLYNVNWIQQLNSPASWIQGIACDASGNNVFAGIITNDGIYISNDSGYNWTQSSAPSANWSSITSDSSGQYLAAVVYGGGIYTSQNSGSSWSQSSAPSANWISITSDSSGQYLAAVVYGGGIYTSQDFGSSWSQSSAPSANWFSITSDSSGQYLAAVISGGHIYTSQDFGSTWSQSSAPSSNWVSITSDSSGQYLAANGSNNNYVYTSSNYGSSWTQQNNSGIRDWSCITSSQNGSIIAAGDAGPSTAYIHISLDYGINWTTLTSTQIPYSATGYGWNCITMSDNGYKLFANRYNNHIYSINATPQISTTGFISNDNDLNSIFAPQITDPGSSFTVTNFTTNCIPLWTSTQGTYDLGQIFQNL